MHCRVDHLSACSTCLSGQGFVNPQACLGGQVMRLVFRLWRFSGKICSMERYSQYEAWGGLGIGHPSPTRQLILWCEDLGYWGMYRDSGWSILEISCTDQPLVWFISPWVLSLCELCVKHVLRRGFLYLFSGRILVCQDHSDIPTTYILIRTKRG